jgi:hypothetical protein
MFPPGHIETGTDSLHNRAMRKVWSSVMVAGMVSTFVGCVDGAKLIQEHENGGVVVYPFKGEQGSLLSVFRKEALAVIDKKCGERSYAIVREGETKGRMRVISPIEGQEELIEERRWGIQFQCR